MSDLVVVGAGPVGLFAAFYAGLRGMSVTVVDSLDEPGGQISALYPEKLIRDVAGLPSVRGRDLVDALVRQAEPFSPQWRLGHSAISLDGDDSGFRIGCADGSEIAGRSVLITGGIGTFTPRPLPGVADYLGRGVSYFVRDPAVLAGRRVLIVGGGDSAFDWADALHGIAGEVVMVHRRDRFRAHQDTVDRVLGHGVRIHTNSQVQALCGEAYVQAAVIADMNTGETTTVECDDVVAALGFVANLGPIAQWGLDLHERKIRVDPMMRTNRPGVFAAGDICTYSGRVPLIAIGFGEAATAVNHAAVFVDPSSSVFPGHSTDTPAAVSTAA
ncbi:NAD(P)/FAD-dependent oxidoreductase [Pseudonocardia xinjiangensis]|uniref:NAD(P)/FAD-dependent oxidoreductase n=1 Tax=Pseudonocardia xinjiangensis TaxID=75289 RepID=UPI003D8B45F3